MASGSTERANGGPSARVTRLGLISDTHGWLDPRVEKAFAAEQPLAGIVHAGDIGDAYLLDHLEAMAPPVTAVLGNCDLASSHRGLGPIARRTVAGVTVLAVHDIHTLGPVPEGVDVVVYGHSHSPVVRREGNVLFVNPGSATQRRRMPSASVGILEIAEDGTSTARIIALDRFGERERG